MGARKHAEKSQRAKKKLKSKMDKNHSGNMGHNEKKTFKIMHRKTYKRHLKQVTHRIKKAAKAKKLARFALKQAKKKVEKAEKAKASHKHFLKWKHKYKTDLHKGNKKMKKLAKKMKKKLKKVKKAGKLKKKKKSGRK